MSLTAIDRIISREVGLLSWGLLPDMHPELKDEEDEAVRATWDITEPEDLLTVRQENPLVHYPAIGLDMLGLDAPEGLALAPKDMTLSLSEYLSVLRPFLHLQLVSKDTFNPRFGQFIHPLVTQVPTDELLWFVDQLWRGRWIIGAREWAKVRYWVITGGTDEGKHKLERNSERLEAEALRVIQTERKLKDTVESNGEWFHEAYWLLPDAFTWLFAIAWANEKIGSDELSKYQRGLDEITADIGNVLTMHALEGKRCLADQYVIRPLLGGGTIDEVITHVRGTYRGRSIFPRVWYEAAKDLLERLRATGWQVAIRQDLDDKETEDRSLLSAVDFTSLNSLDLAELFGLAMTVDENQEHWQASKQTSKQFKNPNFLDAISDALREEVEQDIEADNSESEKVIKKALEMAGEAACFPWELSGKLAEAGGLVEVSPGRLRDVLTGFLVKKARTGHVPGVGPPPWAAAAEALVKSGQGRTASALLNAARLLKDTPFSLAARAYSQASTEIYEALHRQDPKDLMIAEKLVTSLNNLGNLLSAAGRVEETERSLGRAVEISEALYRQDPEDLMIAERLGNSLNNLGNLLSTAGRVEEAERAYGRAVEIREAIYRETPLGGFANELQTSLNNLGNLLSAAGRVEEAERALGRAVEISEGLYRQIPENVEIGEGLGAALNNLGKLLCTTGRVGEAERALARAVEIFEALYRGNPENVTIRKRLGAALNNLGILLSTTGRVEEAERALARAVEIREALYRQIPENIEIKADYAGSLCSIKQYAKAKALVDEVLAVVPRHTYANQLAKSIAKQAVSSKSKTRDGSSSLPHPGANPERAAQLSMQYIQDLRAWEALPWSRRIRKKRPEPPTGI